MQKKNQVLFGEIVRLGEAQDKDRGFARTEITEIAGLLSNFEKRVSGSADTVDRISKDHGSKLVNIDGIINVLESGLNNFGRDMQKVAVSVAEEMKSRKQSDDAINNTLDEFRSATANRFSTIASSSDTSMRQLEEAIKHSMDSQRLEGERGRKVLSEELKALKVELGNQEFQRSALASSIHSEMASHTDELQHNINSLKQDTAETLSSFKAEEMEAIKKQMEQNEDMKTLVLDLERQVFENSSVANSRIDRTRIALEEVIRAEIQVRREDK